MAQDICSDLLSEGRCRRLEGDQKMTTTIYWKVYSRADLPRPGLISSLVFTPFDGGEGL